MCDRCQGDLRPNPVASDASDPADDSAGDSAGDSVVGSRVGGDGGKSGGGDSSEGGDHLRLSCECLGLGTDLPPSQKIWHGAEPVP